MWVDWSHNPRATVGLKNTPPTTQHTAAWHRPSARTRSARAPPTCNLLQLQQQRHRHAVLLQLAVPVLERLRADGQRPPPHVLPAHDGVGAIGGIEPTGGQQKKRAGVQPGPAANDNPPHASCMPKQSARRPRQICGQRTRNQQLTAAPPYPARAASSCRSSSASQRNFLTGTSRSVISAARSTSTTSASSSASLSDLRGQGRAGQGQTG